MLRLALTAAALGFVAGCGASQSGSATDDIRSGADIGLQPDPIAGPFASLQAYCDLVAQEGRTCQGPVREIQNGVTPPYKAVSVIQVASANGTRHCEMVVATAAGWSVAERLFACGEPGATVAFEITTLELVPQTDNPAIVRAELRREERDGKTTVTTDQIALCGLGPDGVLCTGAFTRVEHVLFANGEESHRAASLTLSRFGVLKVNGDGVVRGRPKDITGTYRLRFE